MYPPNKTGLGGRRYLQGGAVAPTAEPS